jgi:hypothetical protein
MCKINNNTFGEKNRCKRRYQGLEEPWAMERENEASKR